MRNITIEKLLLLVITLILLYVTLSMTEVVDHQQKCMAAMVQDMLAGKVFASQVVCSGAIK